MTPSSATRCRYILVTSRCVVACAPSSMARSRSPAVTVQCQETDTCCGLSRVPG